MSNSARPTTPAGGYPPASSPGAWLPPPPPSGYSLPLAAGAYPPPPATQPRKKKYESMSAQLQGPDGSISCTTTVTDNDQTASQTGQAPGDCNIGDAEVCNEGDGLGGWHQC
jgi:hypothetical protein